MQNFFQTSKGVLTATVLAASIGLVASANADTAILDQISAGISDNIYDSQYFESANSAFNIAAADDFTAPSALRQITKVQAVIGGYNGYTDYTGITGWQVDVYSSEAKAGSNLVGDVFSENLTPSQVTVDSTTYATDDGALVTLPANFTLPAAGTYYVAVIADNAFGENGQAGPFGSAATTGGLNAFQANPNGGFGFKGPQTISPATDLAYSVYAVPEPKAYTMMGIGALSLVAMLRLRRRTA